jgi:hypothetical protein
MMNAVYRVRRALTRSFCDDFEIRVPLMRLFVCTQSKHAQVSTPSLRT